MSSSGDLWKELARELERRAQFLSMALKDFIVNVTSSNLDKLLKENKTVILYFTAEWCGPCVNFYRTYKDVASKLLVPGVVFGKVDVDAAYTVADKFKIRHIPTILVLANGKVVDSVVGQVSAEELERKLRQYVTAAGDAT